MSYRRKNIEITWWGLTVRVWQQECLLTELACLHTDVCVRTCTCCCGLTQCSSWSTVTWIKASPTELHTMDINRTLLLDLPFSFLILENCLNLGYNYDASTWLTIDSFFYTNDLRPTNWGNSSNGMHMSVRKDDAAIHSAQFCPCSPTKTL